ncbi:hypothetical protein F66182_5050 [Fusarium sp. NRRL 66182]|nr:hypothetical protein F66182_5050 [Fusarium sp. NRRL 66182]
MDQGSGLSGDARGRCFLFSLGEPGGGRDRYPICVQATLCRLCRFSIEEGKEKMVILTADGCASSPFLVQHEEQIVSFSGDKSMVLSPTYSSRAFSSCKVGIAIAFHAPCASVAVHFGLSLAKYAQVTKYAHNPPQGVKLRKLLKPSTSSRMLWPCLLTSSELKTMSLYYAGWGEGEIMARMRAFDFNKHGTTGYSVCWSGHEMVSLHAHRDNENRQSEYDSLSRLRCTYHPLDQGEFVQQVWLRGPELYAMAKPLPSQGDGGVRYHLSTPWGLEAYKRPCDLALGLVTSKARTIIAGSFPDHYGPRTPFAKHHTWLLIATAQGQAPIRMFFSPSPHGIPLIAAPAHLPDNHSNPPPPMQRPLTPMPRHNPIQALHYSWASLNDVAEVLVCKSKNNTEDDQVAQRLSLQPNYDKVAGLLLRYANGNEASVGCFRFDWSEPPLSTSSTKGLFLGIGPGRIGQISSHVAAVSVTPPDDAGKWTWRELPWTGTLEWWFTPESLDTSISHV